MFGALDISTSALVAQRTRMDAIAGNIANAATPADPDGDPGPYRRRMAIFATGNPAAGRDAPGVHVSEILEDPSPPDRRFDPGHPLAAKTGKWKGYVAYPNVKLSTEMINAVEANRAYEANITVMGATKSMISAALRLLA
ncbi:MAG: flagellar basal body rod protein FlgC [Phycisphaerae bacterium]|nr:flagellar basal body rod protein FlgC [Phycisphaerae bacterium]